MAENAVPRDGGGVIAGRVDEFATAQILERSLDGALRKAGRISQVAQAFHDRSPFVPGGLTVKIQIDEISRRLAIVADDVAQQNVDDIIIDWNGFAKTGQGKLRG